MLFGGQEITQVYTQNANEFNLFIPLMPLILQRKQTIANFIGGYPVLGPNLVST